jgi:hypothetical protein
MSKQKYTQEQIDKAIAMKREGAVTPDITAATGIPLASLKQIFRKNNVKLTDEQRAKATIGRRWIGHEPINKDGLKYCPQCKAHRPINMFYDDTNRLSGKTVYCISCYSDQYKKNPEIHKASTKAYKKKYPEKVKAGNLRLYKRNPGKYKRQATNWRAANIERKREIERKSGKKHQRRKNARTALYRAQKRQATPIWLSPEDLQKIFDIYQNCPIGYHVDHIVPLHGEQVSGLHVPWNLQYLPAEDNLKKSNKFGKKS